MALKQKVYERCGALLEEKIKGLRAMLLELEKGSENDTKSSVGDKHETARAMMQLEQEKISRQLKEALEQRSGLEKIISLPVSSKINTGSLVKTNAGYLLLSIPFGKVQVNQTNIMLLSPRSPLALKLVGHKKGDKTEFNGVAYLIESIE